MNRLLCGNAANTPDIKYLSGFGAADDFVWFETDDMKAVVVSPLEVGRAHKQCRTDITVIDSFHIREFFHLPDSSEAEKSLPFAVRQIKMISEGTGVRHWCVNPSFPLALARTLEGISITVETLSPFAPERRVKDPSEVECIRHSQRLAESGLARADQILRDATIGDDQMLYWNNAPLTAEILRGEIDAAIVRLGGLAQGTIAAPGPQGADPHQCGTGHIPANVPIVMDIFPYDQSTGYYGDLTRTRVKGKATPEVVKAHQCVLEAQQMILESLKPGYAANTYHLMVEEHFKNAGYKTGFDEKAQAYFGFFHGLGHSLGLEIHESPHMNQKDTTILQAGHVVTVEPGIYYPEWGGIRIEDTVAISKDGIDNLTVATKELVIR